MLNTTELGRRIERRPLPRLETLLRWMDAIDLNEDMRSLLEESIEELRDVALGLVSVDQDRSASLVPDGSLWQDTAIRAPIDFLTEGVTGTMFVTQEMIDARNALDCYDEDGDDYIDEGERQFAEDLEMDGWASDELIEEGLRATDDSRDGLEPLSALPTPQSQDVTPGPQPGSEADDNDVRLPSVDEEAWDEVLDAIGGPEEGFATWPHPHQVPRPDGFDYLEEQEETPESDDWEMASSALDLLRALESCLPTDLDASDFTRRARPSLHHAGQG